MNHWMLLFPLLLLPLSACARDIYQIRPLSEVELVAMYERMMLDALRHADADWHSRSDDGYWGNGISDGNEGVRAISHMVLTCGALLRYSGILRGPEREKYRDKATAAIRYAVSTHVTGTKTCTDGSKWGNSWQSAMWTGCLAFGAWLMWDELDFDLRRGIERTTAFEADRFLAMTPPTNRWNDTKAEENGWTVPCLAAAANMFPSHPHAAAWEEKAREYMMNTLSVPRDLRDSTLVDGRPVKDWVSGPNLHPDFTLENHGVFHPSYVQCSSYFLTEAAMCYVYAGRPIPQAADHHLMDTWRMFQTILLPWGETAFPQGMDWEQHGLPAVNLFASLATHKSDPFAAEMEKTILQYMRVWQEWCNGGLEVPGSPFGFTRHAIQAEQTTWGYLAHKVFRRETRDVGAGVELQRQRQTDGVRYFSSIGVLLHRTGSMLASFSWKYRVMGMLLPAGESRIGNPFFTVPITNGFVGSIELSPAGGTEIKVKHRAWRKTSDGFEASVTLITHGGRLEQRLRIASLGEKTVVYEDRVTALSDVSLIRELGMPLGIENDRLTGGTRVVYHQDGKAVFGSPVVVPTDPVGAGVELRSQQESRQLGSPVTIPGTWANVDGRLGIISAAGPGMSYAQGKAYNAQGVCVDVLYVSCSDQPREFKAGEEVAHRIVVLLAEATPEETQALSQSLRIENLPHGKGLEFRLPEGKPAQVPLLW